MATMSILLATLVVASAYGDPRDVKRTGETRVATGALFNPKSMTAAHRTMSFGSKVTLSHGHKKIVVTIVDRGPWIKGRTFDLTPAANSALLCGGLCRVKVEPYPPLPRPRPQIEIADAIQWGEENEAKFDQ